MYVLTKISEGNVALENCPNGTHYTHLRLLPVIFPRGGDQVWLSSWDPSTKILSKLLIQTKEFESGRKDFLWVLRRRLDCKGGSSIHFQSFQRAMKETLSVHLCPATELTLISQSEARAGERWPMAAQRIVPLTTPTCVQQRLRLSGDSEEICEGRGRIQMIASWGPGVGLEIDI